MRYHFPFSGRPFWIAIHCIKFIAPAITYLFYLQILRSLNFIIAAYVIEYYTHEIETHIACEFKHSTL